MDLNTRYMDPMVDAARAGDERALSELWNTWKPLAYKSARKYLTEKDDLDQAVSQGLSKVIMNLDKWKGTGPFAAWLAQVVRNETLDWIRLVKDRVKNCQDIENYEAAVKDRYSDHRALNLIGELVDRLPARQRFSFKLVVYEELSYDKAAVRMGTTAGSVKSNVHEAKVKLRKKLSRTGLR
jgi:RNA polymerase sigma-70 factor (ECF subfamily)